MIWLNCGDEGLINLSRFDRVITNGWNNGKRGSTHWLEAERMIRAPHDLSDDEDRVVARIRFCQSDDDCWDKFEALVEKLRAVGIIVIDADLTAAEQSATNDQNSNRE